MTGRTAIAALALVGLVGGLAWAGATLHGVFADERAEARAAVDGRRRVLERYAAAELENRLDRRLARARPRIEAALADPLAPAAGLYSRTDRRLTLPRPGDGRPAEPGDPHPVFDRYTALRDPAARPAGEGPWGERLRRRNAVFDALAGADPGAIEATIRGFLAHRLLHVLSPERELTSTLAVLDTFAATVEPDPRLLTAVLHDGLGEGPTVEGLQRTLLRHRGMLTSGDFDRFAELVLELSRRGEVPRAAFAAARHPPPPPPMPTDVIAPTLAMGGTWYVAPHPAPPAGVPRVDGVRIDGAAEVAAIQDLMRRGALLGPDESLAFDPLAPVPVSVASPDWVEAPARARATWRLKVGLLWTCALLVVAVGALVLLDVRRRRRFVALKSDFVAAVSHELRTPLAAIRLMAETLERRLVDVERARDYPARIVREVDGLGFLVENLLSFNRIDKGRWVARTRPMGPGDTIRRIADGIDAAIERAEPVRWDLSDIDGLHLDADPALFELMMANLMRNAVQHAADGPLTVTVTGTVGDPTRIRVADTGPGIAADARRHIFEPFFRAPGRTSRGSGLGLALARRIAALHGGRLTLVQTGPGGTVFDLELPAAAGAAPDA